MFGFGKRSDESQMDFQWQNQHGPIDGNSPFVQYAKDRALQSQTDSIAKKRSFSVLNTPNKASNVPGLREPASSHTVLFPQPSPTKPLSSLPPHLSGPSFSTPRKPQAEVDSSGPESSPENNADSEATPENMGLRSRLAGASKAVTKFVGSDSENQNPFALEPHKSASQQEVAAKNYSHAVERRVRKNRDRKFFTRRKASSASDTESDAGKSGRKSKQRQKEENGVSNIAAFFGFIHNHPSLPHILSYYAQLALNVFFMGILATAFWQFWSVIKSDVDKKVVEAAQDIMAEMAACAKNYKENGCELSNRPPALNSVCDNWDRCMGQDPMAIGRSKLSAHTFAEIFNSLIEPISFKAMAFIIVLAVVIISVPNVGLYMFRNKATHQQDMHYQQYPPPTPRHASGPQYAGNYWEGYQQSPMRLMEPGPSMAPIARDGAESPTRPGRLQYR